MSLHHDLRQLRRHHHHSRWASHPPSAIHDGAYFPDGRGGRDLRFGESQGHDLPTGHCHSRPRKSSLTESTLVNEDFIGAYVPYGQGPLSYIDAASCVTVAPDGFVAPQSGRSEASEHRLNGSIWRRGLSSMPRDSDSVIERRRVREDARRHASAFVTPCMGPSTLGRNVELFRPCTVPFCAVCVDNKPARKRDGEVTVTLDRTFDKIGFMIVGDDDKTAHWIGPVDNSTPPPLLEKRLSRADFDSNGRRLPVQQPVQNDASVNGRPRSITYRPIPIPDLDALKAKTCFVRSNRSSARQALREEVPNAAINRSRASSEKAASDKEADKTNSVKSTKSAASNASKKSENQDTACADTAIDDGSSLGINIFFD